MMTTVMCVHVPGEHGERRSGHQRVAVLHPGYQSTVAGREARGFWQSPGRDGGWILRNVS